MILDELTGNRGHILDSMRGVKHRVEQYDWLQKSLHSRDVVEDIYYQREFNSYYKVIARPEHWRHAFYSILEREKYNSSIQFDGALNELFLAVNQVELSYMSKLIATINPHKPVFDAHVGTCLNLTGPKPTWDRPKRLHHAQRTYRRLTEMVDELIQQGAFVELRDSFDHEFPEFSYFTDTKKLDLFMWRYGDVLKVGN